MPKKWSEVKDKKESVLAELKECADSTHKTSALSKVNAAKKWPPDSGTLSAIQKLYEDAAKVEVEDDDAEQNIDVALKSTSKPKFMHNATSAGTIPVWTFQFTDRATKKTGEVEITMNRSMGKDEPTAKRAMADAAIKEIKKRYPNATVKVNNTSLDR